MDRRRIAARVEEMLALVQMAGYERRRPHELSGGQRQRVALARALAKMPKLLLLDEPLAALDRKLRAETRLELTGIQERVGITFLVVTHDQEEALSMASRVAVMDRGRVVQTGAPAEIYERPASRFVADFVGEVNLFEGELIAGFNCLALAVAGFPEPIPLPCGMQLPEGAAVALAVRPEKLVLSRCASHRVRDCRDGVVDRLSGRRLDRPSRDQSAEGAQGLSARHRGELVWPRHAGMGDLAAR